MRVTILQLGVLVLVAGSSAGCGREETAGPAAVDLEAANRHDADDEAIIVTNTAELVAALTPENAGRRIRLRAGSYPLTAPLVVPDSIALEGEGDMDFDGSGQPAGFAAGTATTLSMTANVPGNILTLGHRSAVRRLQIIDLAGRQGNAIGVLSRAPGDAISARVAEVEIQNPNPHAIIPAGPVGCGLVVLTQNPGLGGAPPPHEGASLAVRMSRSIVRSPATGTGCGVFAFNFAAQGDVSVALTNNVIGGGIIANGGVSRTDAVHDASTRIYSVGNLYRDDSPNPCAAPHLGWNLLGGSGAPVPLVLPETARNSLRIQSIGDQISGFPIGIVGAGGRRFFAAPTAGATTGNTLELHLFRSTITTPACGGAPFVADLRLSGASVASATLAPGDGNVLRATFVGVTGSGARANAFANVLGPTGPLAAEFQGTGNQLEIAGTLNGFVRGNRSIEPLPAEEFFTGRRSREHDRD